jgi:hypothetical protein
MTDLTPCICQARRWRAVTVTVVVLGYALLGFANAAEAQCQGVPDATPNAASGGFDGVRFGAPCLAPNDRVADVFDDIDEGLSDIGESVAGGFTGAIGFVGAAYVDELAEDAVGLPPAFADIIREFMNLEDFPGAFAEEDLQRVRILPQSHPGADQFITDGRSGVTLDTLVIATDERYDQIMNWNRSWAEVLEGALSSPERKALFLMLHELVHVRQFRELGRQAFLDEYLPSVLDDGDHGARLEQEAYSIAPRKGSWARDVLDAYAGVL